jgi:hypothetical protein
MTAITLDRFSTMRGLDKGPNELIHSKNNENEHLRPFLMRGRELSNPDPEYIPYFFRIAETAMDGLLKKLKTVRYLDHAIVNNQDNRSDEFYVIFSGKVRVMSNEKERNYLVRETFPNHAEFALLTADLISASHVSLEKAVFSVINNSEFINWLMCCSDVSFGFLGVSSKMQEGD